MLESLELRDVGPAPSMRIEPAPRLNVLAGDNGGGKTLLLEIAWWALTGTWAGYPAAPHRRDGARPELRWVDRRAAESYAVEASYSFLEQQWQTLHSSRAGASRPTPVLAARARRDRRLVRARCGPRSRGRWVTVPGSVPRGFPQAAAPSGRRATMVVNVMITRVASLLLCVATLGCAPSPTPPPTVSLPPPAAPVPTAVPDEGPPVTLHLDSAQAFEVLAAMEAFGGEPVLVDAAALASLRCAGVSVDAPGPLPGRVAAEKIAAVLRAQHYRVEHVAGQWVVSADPASPPATCTPPAPVPVAATDVPDQAAGEVARSIRRVSDTEYVLTRHGVDVLFEHAPALLKRVRIVPEKEGEKVVGLRLFGVRADDTLGRLGIQNGDRVERLAGHDLSSPDHALEAYAALKSAKRAVLEVGRQGAPMKIVYRVE